MCSNPLLLSKLLCSKNYEIKVFLRLIEKVNTFDMYKIVFIPFRNFLITLQLYLHSVDINNNNLKYHHNNAISTAN